MITSAIFAIFDWSKRNNILCIIIYLLLGIVWIIICLPGSLLSFCAGVLFPETIGPLGILLAWALGIANQFIAGQICFYVCRYLLYDVLRDYFETNIILKSIESAIKKRGFKMSFLLRAVGGMPAMVTNYGLPLTSITHLEFMFGFIGGWLWELTMVYYGYCVGDIIKLLLGTYETNYKENILMVILIVLSIVITVISAILAYREIRKESNNDEPPHIEMMNEVVVDGNETHKEINSSDKEQI